MKELTQIQNFIFRLGGVLIIIGIILWIPRFSYAPYIYCVGAIAFASMQFLEQYEGRSLVIRRLRRQQLLGAFFLLVSGVLLIGNTLHLPYLRHNEWVVGLTIAAIFELYTSFRIPSELKKEK